MFLLAHGSVGYHLPLYNPSYSGIGSTFINRLTCCGISQSPDMIWSHPFYFVKANNFAFLYVVSNHLSDVERELSLILCTAFADF